MHETYSFYEIISLVADINRIIARMQKIINDIKDYFLVKYLKQKFGFKSRRLSSDIPWIKKQHLTKTAKDHCNVLIDSLLKDSRPFSFREKKFIVDKVLNSTFDKGSNLLESNTKIHMIKPLLQLNSFVIYEEFIKGLNSQKPKKAIKYNINKELMIIQEKVSQQEAVKEILQERIEA